MEKLVFITEDDEGRDYFIPFEYSSKSNFVNDLNHLFKIQQEKAYEDNARRGRPSHFKLAISLVFPEHSNISQFLYLSLWDTDWEVSSLEDWFSTYQKTLNLNE